MTGVNLQAHYCILETMNKTKSISKERHDIVKVFYKYTRTMIGRYTSDLLIARTDGRI